MKGGIFTPKIIRHSEVKEFITSFGYILKSQYSSIHLPLDMTCPNGHDVSISWNNFKRGRRCKECYHNKQRTPIDEISSNIEKNMGFKLVGHYSNQETPIEIMCPNHHVFPVKYRNFILTPNCPICKEIEMYNTVKIFVENIKNGYKLISPIYINNSTHLEIECDQSHLFPMTLDMLKRGYKCHFCSGHAPISIEDAKKDFNDCNYELLENVFINTNIKMAYRCKKHPEIIQYIALTTLRQGHGCKKCAGERASSILRLDQAIVFEQLTSKGLIPESEESYVNARTPIKYRCKNHPEEIQQITFSSFSQGHSCKYCAYDRNRGEFSATWKGGITQLSNHLRGLLSDWRINSLNVFGNKCIFTGKRKGIEVHHTYPFNKIIKDVLELVNLPIKPCVGDYDNEELQLIEKHFLLFHNNMYGIPILESIHKLYHKLCGFDNNEEEFESFIMDYLNGKFISAFEGGGFMM